jgi:hypothetical protein
MSSCTFIYKIFPLCVTFHHKYARTMDQLMLVKTAQTRYCCNSDLVGLPSRGGCETVAHRGGKGWGQSLSPPPPEIGKKCPCVFHRERAKNGGPPPPMFCWVRRCCEKCNYVNVKRQTRVTCFHEWKIHVYE